MITQVVVNHTERNYFNDYGEIRSDKMVGVTAPKVSSAIDKLARRFRNGEVDVMLVTNDDNTGYMLRYEKVDMEQYVHPTLGTMYRGGYDALRLRHYTYMPSGSWDTEETVSVAKAKRIILGGER